MYLEHFGLAVTPFGISPRLDFLYRSGAFEESMAHLVYGLDNHEAIVVITGAIGTGKTMAIQSFLSHLGDRYESALITNTSVDAKELLKLILEDLGSPMPVGADKSDLLILFKQVLLANGRQGKRLVIFIDEAQNLAREVLEEIRLLTNLGQGAEQPVQIILVGQPELDEMIQRPDLAQLKQRIRVHYKLAPLSRQELEEYVDHRMVVAGGAAGIFTNRALDEVYRLSNGVPRVVNTLCGEGLLSAFVAGRRKVEASDFADAANGYAEVRVPAQPAAEAPKSEAAPAAGPRLAPPAATVEMAARRPAAPSPKPRTGARAPGRTQGARRSRRSGRTTMVVVAVLALVIIFATLTVTGQWKRFEDLAAHAERGQAVSLNEPALVDLGVAAEAATETGRVLNVSGADSAVAVRDTVPAPVLEVVSESMERPAPTSTLQAPATVAEAETVEAAAEPADEAEISPTSASEATEQYIHVSSFRAAEHAAAVARQFTESGLAAVVRGQVVRDVQWYRVYLGPYPSHDAAVHQANGLRDAGAITYYKVIQLDDTQQP
jgi:type II secretory pathway predicted ATPase ExeA